MVFCRGCGQELHESAPLCPHCGAPQTVASAPRFADAGGFFDYALRPFRQYAVFSGRARRKEYWYFLLFLMGVNFMLGFFAGLFQSSSIGMLSTLLVLVTFLPGVAVGVRRLHDSNRSGWWLLLPIVNLILLCQDSEPGSNRYGPSPKYPGQADFSAP
ncbi:DUF805 domain-containing protein [Pseudoduganella sp. FT93W]|uniref:DUF805 domain-containing protein n=2 Tax=Duganella fentianensis TaxID=2692177 RepID=A0A845I1B2_9BURK|nr:DUF805 domain-containing protein [Duganella fentianensis]